MTHSRSTLVIQDSATDSDMLAGKDISLTGKNVAILAAENQSSQTHSVEQKSSGLTLALSDAVGSVLNTAVTTAKDASEENNGRLAALQGVKAALGGAQVSGETVKVDVGRDLLLQSQQDSDNYDSKQTSTSGGVSVAVTGGGSANLSMSQDKLHSNYDSVQEQTGIFAGKGGFDITVGEHTQLDGAVIASTADKSKNSLDTGTLGFSNIENKADFKAEHQGGSLSTGGPVGSDLLSNLGSVVLSGLGNDGHAAGTTQAAIADGTITIRDTDKQQQNVDDLSRDTDNANGSIGPIFDKEKEQNRLREAQLIGEIGGQVSDIVRTQGRIAEEKALKDPEAIQAAKEALAQKGILTPTEEQLTNQIRNTAMAPYGTGSALQQGIQAATAAIQGLAGGNMAQALAGASAPYLAEVIKKSTGDNQAANAMAHAVLGAVTAYASGNSALAGAAGAATAELMVPVIIAAMGWDKNNLSEDQKQTVSALATLAAGLAGGLTGDSTADTVAGAQTGKNAVENNFLKVVAEGCAIAAPCRSKVAEQLLEIGAKAGIAGLAGTVVKDIADKMTSDELEHLVTLKMMGNDEITSKYLSSLQDKYAPFHTGNQDTTGKGPSNTGGNQTLDLSGTPTHTGNNQSSGQGATNTGNTDGKPDTGGNSTVTPIPNGPNKNDLAYMSEKPLGLGSTGRTEPNSLQEKLAMEQTLSNPAAGHPLPLPMADTRWPKEDGWVKMTQSINGVEIHYVRNTKTGQIDDFKFK
ncbi:VENN motif pre-toxin domain-containing protein [Yersinia massiliensis]|uniref:VENN motif pre-toxin domain-containing protein n=1 Tax=Yersinia massiliensis TaxID=419257 RepID=UPI0028F456BD|nr:VENN motif pre-toxin domain-containing protein [Yersinia massiliensis]